MRNRLPDLDVLRLLVTVADMGSMGAAASHLGISQPSASTSIARCERRLGLKLLDRSPRGSTLTPDGTLYVDWARDVLLAADRMELATSALQAAQSAELRIVASLTVSEYLVPNWLGKFSRKFPDVSVQLSVVNSGRAIHEVREGRHDLGFIESTQAVCNLKTSVVCWDELVVVAASSHPWAQRRRALMVAELEGAPLIHREVGSGTRQVFFEACKAAGVRPAEKGVALASNTAVRISAMAGSAPAVLSKLAVQESVSLGDLIVIPVKGIDLKRPIRAIWTGTMRPLGFAAEFLDLAASASGGDRAGGR